MSDEPEEIVKVKTKDKIAICIAIVFMFAILGFWLNTQIQFEQSKIQLEQYKNDGAIAYNFFVYSHRVNATGEQYSQEFSQQMNKNYLKLIEEYDDNELSAYANMTQQCYDSNTSVQQECYGLLLEMNEKLFEKMSGRYKSFVDRGIIQ